MFIYQFASSSSFDPAQSPNCSVSLLTLPSARGWQRGHSTPTPDSCKSPTPFCSGSNGLVFPWPQSGNYSPGWGKKRWSIQTKSPFSSPVNVPSPPQSSTLLQYCEIHRVWFWCQSALLGANHTGGFPWILPYLRSIWWVRVTGQADSTRGRVTWRGWPVVITVLPKDYALAPNCTQFSTGRTYTIPILSHLEYFGLRL